jgi:dTDP-glucose 4,6-dehydratase
MYSKIVITGGAGFAGSHLTESFAAWHPEAQIVVIDKMGYAANQSFMFRLINQPSSRVELVVLDVRDTGRMKDVLDGADLLVHAAAESHVDKSFSDAMAFSHANVIGTHSTMLAALDVGVPLIVHISTDEVYGETATDEFSEEAALRPTNPYAASKAAADEMVLCYARSYGLPVRIMRPNNMYGIRQYPEKLIPRFIRNMLLGRQLPVHGDGSSRRSFLAVEDFCTAVQLVAERGQNGQIYNLASEDEYSVLQIADLICAEFGTSAMDVLEFVADRPHNDCRYGITSAKISGLGWRRQRHLADDMRGIVEWYSRNLALYAPVTQSGGRITGYRRPVSTLEPEIIASPGSVMEVRPY